MARREGTERAFTGKHHRLQACGNVPAPLLRHAAVRLRRQVRLQIEGPNFRELLDSSDVVEEDDSLWMHRTEVLRAARDAHHGHMFPDGTPRTELRYSMNSAAQVLNEEVRMDIEVIDSWTVA